MMFQETIVRLVGADFLNYFDEIFVVFLTIVAIINILKDKKINYTSLIIAFFVIIFIMIGFVSCWVNSNFFLSGFISIKFWLMIIALLNINTENIEMSFFSSLELYTKIVIFVAIINVLLPNLYYSFFKFPRFSRFGFIAVTSLFNHPEKYGWFMLFMTIYYYSKYMREENKKYIKNIIICAFFALLSFRTKVILGIEK